MQITEQQYNAVVGGLRVQLELHQDKQRELIREVETSKEVRKIMQETVDKCCDEIQEKDRRVKALLEQNDAQLEKINQLEVTVAELKGKINLCT